MYSQNNEEEIIVKYFQDKNINGRFLDIGAHDGLRLSNTARLFEMGWSGVCIEPSPIPYALLQARYKDTCVRCFQVAISDKCGPVTFYDSNGENVSTINANECKKWTGTTFTPITVPAITIPILLGQVDDNFEFISIDTEGTNHQVFSQFKWDKMINTHLICVEHEYNLNPILDILVPLGFKQLLVNHENIIMGR